MLLAPIAYAFHHFEENVVLDFRAWRLRYFPDNNALTTEAVLCVLMAVSLAYILMHWKVGSKLSAWAVTAFLMASQVSNALFHVFAGLWFQDFSPGTITGVLLYLPANALIIRAAMQEGLVNIYSTIGLFVFGLGLFTAFEYFGPPPLALFTVIVWILVLMAARKGETKA